jgi:predicted deacylase
VTPSLAPELLAATFERLAASSWLGVPGVVTVDGACDGPCIGITACTHGNEPAGLHALAAVLARIDQGWRPSRGRLVLVLNNLDATARWFGAHDPASRLAARFLDTDMNRLPRDVLSGGGGREGIRARALAAVWQRFDAALDIHSTALPSAPMIVAGQGDHAPLTAGMPIGIVIGNIAAIQIGIPAFALYGGTACEIEAGSHDDPVAWALAEDCTFRFLANAGLLAMPSRPSPPRIAYTVCGALRLPDPSYALSQVFETFHPIRRGDVIASGSAPGGSGIGPDLCAPVDGHVIFAPPGTRPPSLVNETLFFTLPGAGVPQGRDGGVD